MSRLSKQVENRLSVTEKVIASARVHGPATTKSLVELAPGVAYETLFETLAATLGRAAQAMREAELSYTAEQADDVAPRDARDERTAELSKLMSLVRNSVENAVGASGLQTYGLLGPTPRLPAQLANRASNTINLLKSKSAKATDELGSLFSTEAIVAVLEPKVEALQAALKDLDREARELQDALGRRDRAVEAWVECYQGVATTLEGLFRLGGRADLADRVRPTARAVAGEEAGLEVPAEVPNPGAS